MNLCWFHSSHSFLYVPRWGIHIRTLMGYSDTVHLISAYIFGIMLWYKPCLTPATMTGLEPVTSAVTGRRDNQLRHWASRFQHNNYVNIMKRIIFLIKLFFNIRNPADRINFYSFRSILNIHRMSHRRNVWSFFLTLTRRFSYNIHHRNFRSLRLQVFRHISGIYFVWQALHTSFCVFGNLRTINYNTHGLITVSHLSAFFKTHHWNGGTRTRAKHGL